MQYERYLCEAGFLEGKSTRGSSNSRFLFAPHTTLEDKVYEAGGEHYNTNSNSGRCILACLVAGLYPNVATRKKVRGAAIGTTAAAPSTTPPLTDRTA
ncbi:hypothetical protein AGDE_13850 [Angomonas deanei]|uniref:Uncharacterized protein n=1 Tax=Angomonas deanei TaxID=59799 RepID=A0A7G2CNM1_9TRYP|nr:hypothetical protein AGDE_13850 [Angomonas deanei]CAD2220541.1 hypothetical protein, conserved [Angomonas deanei]|eukprot:EPY21704.1 hypothetical protein AGDE_13850 [Angomonas deanei]